MGTAPVLASPPLLARRWLTPLTVVLAVLGAGPVAAQDLPGPCLGLAPALGPFQCYEAHHGPFTAIPGVSLADRFGASSVDVLTPKRLCNPAGMDGEAPAPPADPTHLVGYKIRLHGRARLLAARRVEVENQFGTLVVDLVKAELLMVPSAKSTSAAPPPLGASPIDHFRCSKVSRARFRASGIAIADQFGALQVDVKKPARLCAPVDKNGEGIGDPAAHLMCYKVRTTPGTPRPKSRTVFVHNQFGADSFGTFRATELCLPSIVTVRSPLQLECARDAACGNGRCEPCEGPLGLGACAADCAQDPADPESTCGQIYDPSGTGWVHPDGLTPSWATVGPYGPASTCCDDGYCTADERALGEACADCRSPHCGNLLCEEETECGTGPHPAVLCSSDCSTTDCNPRICPTCGNGVCEGHWGWREVAEVADPETETACPEDCGAIWIPSPTDEAQTGGNDLEPGPGDVETGPAIDGPGAWTPDNGARCGDGICDLTERYQCDADCAGPGYEVCRVDGVCERNISGSPGLRDENGINCPEDCLPSDYVCGDGVCSLTEGLALAGDLPDGYVPPTLCSPAELLADCNGGPDPLLDAGGVPRYRRLCGDPNNPPLGGLAAQRCDARLCDQRHEYYFLDHSNFNVGHTWGNGEHQGLAVRPRDEWWDHRKLADGAGPRRCHVKNYAEWRIHNHGRTVHATDRQQRATTLIRVYEFDRQLRPTSPSARLAEALRRCMQLTGESDGPCDRLCGNDGYCIPNRGLGQWDNDEPCYDAANNLRGYTPKEGNDAAGKPIFRQRCDLSTALGWAAWGSRVVSPRFGHNSNNDAHMILNLFWFCGTVAGKFSDENGAPIWTMSEMAAWLAGSRGGSSGTDPSMGQHGLCRAVCDGDPEAAGRAQNFPGRDGDDKNPPPEQAGKPPCNTGGADEDSRANIATAKWNGICDGCMNLSASAQDVTGNANVQPTASCVTTGGCPACGFTPGKSVTGM